MLHCNMTASFLSLQNGLEDILGDLRFARRKGDLGRLALLAYCEVRRWAREADAKELASHSSALVSNFPHSSRDDFLAAVDQLIAELEQALAALPVRQTAAFPMDAVDWTPGRESLTRGANDWANGTSPKAAQGQPFLSRS